jgi:hypothetical protein
MSPLIQRKHRLLQGHVQFLAGLCSLEPGVLSTGQSRRHFRVASIWRHAELMGDKVTSDQALLPFYSVPLCYPTFHNCSTLNCHRPFMCTIHLAWDFRIWNLFDLMQSKEFKIREDMRSSQPCYWEFRSSGMWPCVTGQYVNRWTKTLIIQFNTHLRVNYL